MFFSYLPRMLSRNWRMNTFLFCCALFFVHATAFAATNTVAPSFAVSPSLNASQTQLTVNTSGNAGHTRTGCSCGSPQYGEQPCPGFAVDDSYLLVSPGSVAVASLSTSSIAFAQSSSGSGGACINGGAEGTVGRFSGSTSVDVSTLPNGSYAVTVTACAVSGAYCANATGSFAINNRTNPVSAQCGTNAKEYSAADSAWPSTSNSAFCTQGSLSGGTPAFPAVGASTSWTCLGQNGGANRTCTATREYAVSGDTTPPNVTIQGAPANWVNTTRTATLNCTDAGSGCHPNRNKMRVYTTNPGSCPASYSSYPDPWPAQPLAITQHSWVCGTSWDNADPVNIGFSTPTEFRVDAIAPTCGTWSTGATIGNQQEMILTGSTDTGGSGIAVAGGTCMATLNGGTCTVTISDSAGNTRACSSPTGSNSQTAACLSKPSNTQWWNATEATSFTQSWNGSTWTPSTVAIYSASNTAAPCDFKCFSGYTWNSSTNSCVAAGECGNGTKVSGEECDDGNITNGDGCSASCTWESRLYSCPAKAPNTIWNTVSSYYQKCFASNGTACTTWAPAPDTVTEYNLSATTSACRYKCVSGYTWDGSACVAPAQCGDGVIGSGEDCDDGNTNNSDGCSSSCKWETRTFTCPAKPANTSWNTVDAYGQICAASNGTTCTTWSPANDAVTDYSATPSSAACQYTCAAGYNWNGTSCILAYCGDGYTDAGEQCDDGNTVEGDGCSNACTLEYVTQWSGDIHNSAYGPNMGWIAFGSVDAHQNLILSMPFEEGSGTNVLDASGNNNRGTLSGGARTSAKYGSGISLDGSGSQIITIPGRSQFNFTGDYTLSAWVNLDTNTGIQGVIGKNSGNGWGLNVSEGKVNFGAHSCGNFNGNTVLKTGKWYHIAAVFKASGSEEIYVNGVLDGTGSLTGGNCGADSSDVVIGRYRNITTSDFRGKIDEVRVYNRALAANETAALVQLYDGLYSGVRIADTPDGGGNYVLSGTAYSLNFGPLDFSGTYVALQGDWPVLRGSASFTATGATLELANGSAPCALYLNPASLPAPDPSNYGICIDPVTGQMHGYAWSPEYGWVIAANDTSFTLIGNSPVMDDPNIHANATYQLMTDWTSGNQTIEVEAQTRVYVASEEISRIPLVSLASGAAGSLCGQGDNITIQKVADGLSYADFKASPAYDGLSFIKGIDYMVECTADNRGLTLTLFGGAAGDIADTPGVYAVSGSIFDTDIQSFSSTIALQGVQNGDPLTLQIIPAAPSWTHLGSPSQVTVSETIGENRNLYPVADLQDIYDVSVELYDRFNNPVNFTQTLWTDPSKDIAEMNFEIHFADMISKIQIPNETGSGVFGDATLYQDLNNTDIPVSGIISPESGTNIKVIRALKDTENKMRFTVAAMAPTNAVRNGGNSEDNTLTADDILFERQLTQEIYTNGTGTSPMVMYTADGANPLGAVPADSTVQEGENTVYQETGSKTLLASDFIPVDTAKRYELSGMFQSIGSGGDSRLYFGLSPYDENKQPISAVRVLRNGSDAVVSATSATEITVANTLSGWSTGGEGYTRNLGFYFDGNTNKLADAVHSDLVNGVYSTANGNTIALTQALPAEITSQILPGVTVVKNHRSGATHMYAGAANVTVPGEWIRYVSNQTITGEDFSNTHTTFRKGTKYVKVVLMLNHGQDSSHEILFDNIRFGEMGNVRQHMKHIGLEPNSPQLSGSQLTADNSFRFAPLVSARAQFPSEIVVENRVSSFDAYLSKNSAVSITNPFWIQALRGRDADGDFHQPSKLIFEEFYPKSLVGTSFPTPTENFFEIANNGVAPLSTEFSSLWGKSVDVHAIQPLPFDTGAFAMTFMPRRFGGAWEDTDSISYQAYTAYEIAGEKVKYMMALQDGEYCEAAPDSPGCAPLPCEIDDSCGNPNNECGSNAECCALYQYDAATYPQYGYTCVENPSLGDLKFSVIGETHGNVVDTQVNTPEAATFHDGFIPYAAVQQAIRRNVAELTRGVTPADISTLLENDLDWTEETSPYRYLLPETEINSTLKFQNIDALFAPNSGNTSENANGTARLLEEGKVAWIKTDAENQGCTVVLEEDSILSSNAESSPRTLILEGCNLYIKGNITGDGYLGIIVLKNRKNRANKMFGRYGNIFIDPAVTNMKAAAFTEGSLLTMDQNLGIISGFVCDEQPEECSETLGNQLYLKGAFASQNTVGGASLVTTESTGISGIPNAPGNTLLMPIDSTFDSYAGSSLAKRQDIAEQFDLTRSRRFLRALVLEQDQEGGENGSGDGYIDDCGTTPECLVDQSGNKVWLPVDPENMQAADRFDGREWTEGANPVLQYDASGQLTSGNPVEATKFRSQTIIEYDRSIILPQNLPIGFTIPAEVAGQ